MGKYGEKIVGNSIYVLFGTVVVYIFSIFRSIISARLLGPENLGILSILSSFDATILPLILFGLTVAITKYIAEFKIKDKYYLEKILSTIVALLLIFSIVGSLIYFLFSDLIAIYIFNQPALVMLFKIQSLFLIISVMIEFGLSTLQGFQDIKNLSLLRILNVLIGFPLTYIFIIKMGLLGAVISGVIINIISLIIIWYFLRKVIKRENLKIRIHIHKKFLKDLFVFSLPLTLSAILVKPAYFYGNSYLALTNGFEAVGLFKIAFAFYNWTLFIPIALSISLLPIMSELNNSTVEDRSITSSKILKMVLLMVLPLCISMGIFSKYLISILYGNMYIDAYYVTFIMIVTTFFSTFFIVGQNIFVGTGRTYQAFGFDILVAITFITTSHYFIGYFGVMGLGLAYLFTNIIQLPIELFYLVRKKELKLEIIIQPLILGIVFILLSFLIIKFTAGMNTVVYGTFIVIILLILEFLIFTQEERLTLRNILRKAISKLFKSY